MIPRYGSILSTMCWVIGGFILGVAAIGLQMDREARTNSAIAPLVPSVFKGYALETLALKAYAEQQYLSGLGYARELVLRRPVPAEGLSLVAQGMLMGKQKEQALPVLLLAAQRGWRDRVTQRLMITLAVQVGDAEVASQRLLALWRLGEHDDRTMALTRDVIEMENGLVSFRQGLNKADTWVIRFLIWAKDNLTVQSIEDISVSLSEKHVEIDCSSLSNMVRALARTGNGRAATNIWSRLCGTGPITTPLDLTFKDTADAIGPFDWTYTEYAGLDSELVDVMGKMALHYDYADQIRVVLAKRFTQLTAGAHTARIEMEDGTGIESRPRVLRINCLSSSGTSTWSEKINLSEKPELFHIPASGCLTQEVQLIVGRGSGLIRQIIID